MLELQFKAAKGKLPANHAHGEPASGDFNYSSVVGILLYLAGHTCRAITYDVNYPARYICFAKSLCMNMPSSKLAAI